MRVAKKPLSGQEKSINFAYPAPVRNVQRAPNEAVFRGFSKSRPQRRLLHGCASYGAAVLGWPRRDFKLAEEAGFATATTTRKGLLYSEHKGHMLALPRISINGDYQNIRFIKLLLSGAPFMVFNKFRKLNVV